MRKVCGDVGAELREFNASKDPPPPHAPLETSQAHVELSAGFAAIIRHPSDTQRSSRTVT